MVLKTGKLAWTYPWVTRYDENIPDPVVNNDTIFISTNHGNGCVLLRIKENKPEVIWKNMNMDSHFSSFIYLDGYIYGNDGFAGYGWSTFKCLDIRTGKEMWGESLGLGSLISAGGKLILLNERGDLFIAEATPEGYREISFARSILPRTCWTPPSFSDGRIYCRNDKGELISIDARK